MARQHAGTVNPRYLAPPIAVLAMVLGTLAGIAGLAGLLSGAAGAWPAAACGLAVPALYAAGILGVAAITTRFLRRSAVAWIPAVLATMHIAWGIGFLTSPRSLIPGNGSSPRWSRPAGGAARPAGAAASPRLPDHLDR